MMVEALGYRSTVKWLCVFSSVDSFTEEDSGQSLWWMAREWDKRERF